LAADFDDDFDVDFDDDAGKLADAAVEAPAGEAGILETELLESDASDGAGASAGSSVSPFAGSAEASGVAAVSEVLLELASDALASPEPPDRESFAPATAGERAKATASIHPKNNRIRSSVRI
jgi:hypothetical protein